MFNLAKVMLILLNTKEINIFFLFFRNIACGTKIYNNDNTGLH